MYLPAYTKTTSKGYLYTYKAKYSIRAKIKITREALAANKGAGVTCLAELKQMIEEGEFNLEKAYNMVPVNRLQKSTKTAGVDGTLITATQN